MTPGEQTSRAIAFTLLFPTRRRLQGVDTNSEAFLSQLKQSLIRALPSGVTESFLRVSPSNTRGEVQITIIGLDALERVNMAPSVVVASVRSPTFLTALGSDLGVSVILATPPSITTRITAGPAPPLPPSPPSPPATPPILASSSDAITADSNISSGSVSAIIVSTLTALLVLGCFAVYAYGKRQGRKHMVDIAGRPQMRRGGSGFPSGDDTASDGDDSARMARAEIPYIPNVPRQMPGKPPPLPASPAHSGVVRLTPDEISLVELGMQVQMTREASLSPRSQRSPRGTWHVEVEFENPASPHRPITPSNLGGMPMERVHALSLSREASVDDGTGVVAISEIAAKLDSAQAAIDAVRESLNHSPRGEASTNPRASASAWTAARIAEAHDEESSGASSSRNFR